MKHVAVGPLGSTHISFYGSLHEVQGGHSWFKPFNSSQRCISLESDGSCKVYGAKLHVLWKGTVPEEFGWPDDYDEAMHWIQGQLRAQNRPRIQLQPMSTAPKGTMILVQQHGWSYPYPCSWYEEGQSWRMMWDHTEITDVESIIGWADIPEFLPPKQE